MNFMKLFNLIKNWFNKSNRKEHMYLGTVIYIISFLFCLILSISIINCAIISTFVVFGCMASVEYKDKRYGNKFDWSDIISGMIFPTIVSFVITIWYVIQ